MMNYLKETDEFQRAALEGNVKKCLRFFKEKYEIEVRIFDANKALLNYERVKQDDPELKYYYLIYWGEHVFPC